MGLLAFHCCEATGERRSTSERLSFNARWGATLFGGAAVHDAPVPLDRSLYPTIGAGVHFVIKPVQRMIVNLEVPHGHRGTNLRTHSGPQPSTG